MIGVFDSGLGGLTAVKEISRRMPEADIVYFGDTGRVPYGSRSKDVLLKYSAQDMRFLLSCGKLDAVLVACGTISSTALDYLRDSFDVPILGIIDASAKKAAAVTKKGIIGAIGTGTTISSGAFPKAIGEIDPALRVISTPCPMFVPLVENGFVDEDDPVTRLVAERYLAPMAEAGIDTLILGCTHFPILEKNLQKVLPGVTMINSGAEAAKQLVEQFPQSGKGEIRYYVSDEVYDFKRIAATFLGSEIGAVQKIDIEKY